MKFRTIYSAVIYSVMQSDRNTLYGNASSQNMKFMSSLDLIFCGNPCFPVVHDFVISCLKKNTNQLFHVNMLQGDQLNVAVCF